MACLYTRTVLAIYTKPSLDEVWQLSGRKADLRLVARNLTREVYELREKIRQLEEEKGEMLTAEKLGQVYKEGELRGYLRHALDIDATLAKQSDSFDPVRYAHLLDEEDEYYPHEMGRKIGNLMFGAYTSYHHDRLQFDVRMYKPDDITHDSMYCPLDRTSRTAGTFWKGVCKGASRMDKQINERGDNDDEAGLADESEGGRKEAVCFGW